MYSFSLTEINQILRHHLLTYKCDIYQRYDYDLYQIDSDQRGWYAFVPSRAANISDYFSEYRQFVNRAELTRRGQCAEWNISILDPLVVAVALPYFLRKKFSINKAGFLGMVYESSLLYGEYKGQPFLMNLFTECTSKRESYGRYAFPPRHRSPDRIALLKIMPIGSSEYLDIMYTVLAGQLYLANRADTDVLKVDHFCDNESSASYMVNNGVVKGLNVKTAIASFCILPKSILAELSPTASDAKLQKILEEPGAISLDEFRDFYEKFSAKNPGQLLTLSSTLCQPMNCNWLLWKLREFIAMRTGVTKVDWRYPENSSQLVFKPLSSGPLTMTKFEA